MKPREVTVEGLAEMIRAYARSLGIKPRQVGRDGFVAAHRNLLQVNPIKLQWAAAKSLATDGESPAPPVEPMLPGQRIAGVSSYVDADGVVRGQWIKTRTQQETDSELIARVSAETLARIKPRDWTIPAPTDCVDELLAVYPLGDPHVGLLAWAPETGADFDLSAVERLMVGAMQDLVHRGPRARRGIVVNLGDFFHFDNASARTTKGEHTLDVDSRAPKVLAVGLRIMVALITRRSSTTPR